MYTLYKFHFLNEISEINQLFDDILIIWPAPVYIAQYAVISMIAFNSEFNYLKDEWSNDIHRNNHATRPVIGIWQMWEQFPPMQVCVVVKPVRECTMAVERKALMQEVESHILKSVVIQCSLKTYMKHLIKHFQIISVSSGILGV